jgi:hypothetical protein
MAANVITHHSADMVQDVYTAASSYLFATLDWLNPYHNEHDILPEMDNDFDNSNTSFPTLDL